MPICTICGQEVTFIPQYQQWYCPNCRTYPYLRQAQAQWPPAPHPMAQAAPFQAQAMAPTIGSAVFRIRWAVSMRAATDRMVSTKWVAAVIALQVIFPILAFSVIYWVVLGMDITVLDWHLLLAFLVVILMSIMLAAVHAVLVHKLVSRRDDHFKRDAMLRQGMEEYLGAASLADKLDLNVERWTMNTLHIGSRDYERSAMTWALLVGLIAIIPIVGAIFLIYCQVFLTNDVHEHERRQIAHAHFFQQGLLRAGRIQQPFFTWPELNRRDVSIYVILTILTLGFFLPYWWYVNIHDMNEHMRNQADFEAALLGLISEGQA